MGDNFGVRVRFGDGALSSWLGCLLLWNLNHVESADSDFSDESSSDQNSSFSDNLQNWVDDEFEFSNSDGSLESAQDSQFSSVLSLDGSELSDD
jgi:hypothetical protein